MICVWNLWTLPFDLAFVVPENVRFVDQINWIGDFVLMFNLIVNASFNPSNDYSVTVGVKDLQNLYLKSWFFLDFIACIPLDICLIGFLGVAGARWIRLLRILLTVLVIRYFRLYRINLYAHEKWRYMSGFSLLLIVFTIAHWLACIYWKFTKTEGFALEEDMWLPSERYQNEGNFSCYIRSLWHAMTLLTGFGGAKIPETNLQAIYSFFSVFGGVFIFGWVVASMEDLISDDDSTSALLHREVEISRRFMRKRDFPPGLTQRVTKHVALEVHTKQGVEIQKALNGLSISLQSEIRHRLFYKSLAKVPIFADQHIPNKQTLLMELTKYISIECFPAGEWILYKGDIGDSMYFIVKGQCGIVLDLAQPDKVLKIIGAGAFFGEGALLNSTTRTASIRAEMSSELMKLSRTNFEKLAMENDAFRDAIQNISHARNNNIKKASKEMARRNQIKKNNQQRLSVKYDKNSFSGFKEEESKTESKTDLIKRTLTAFNVKRNSSVGNVKSPRNSLNQGQEGGKLPKFKRNSAPVNIQAPKSLSKSPETQHPPQSKWNNVTVEDINDLNELDTLIELRSRHMSIDTPAFSNNPHEILEEEEDEEDDNDDYNKNNEEDIEEQEEGNHMLESQELTESQSEPKPPNEAPGEPQPQPQLTSVSASPVKVESSTINQQEAKIDCTSNNENINSPIQLNSDRKHIEKNIRSRGIYSCLLL